ncbi:GIN domain-containing protein [Eleftheria terrae]|uniref:GIN domain-containing protein n=1 Tax=Eleftheria terrae TaxID=1597781 RepID=UPI00263B360B|nr:DUF2807 domain-containing protein [Eleftheria terrae]WKB50558.1 DUF2807 domain-containing protein [Eleftheria terrae]
MRATAQAVTYSSNGTTTITTTGSNSVVIVNGRVVGSGNAVEAKGPNTPVQRNAEAYNKIHVAIPGEFKYSTSTSRSLVVEAPANILPLVKTSVRSGTLYVTLEGSVTLKEPIKVIASGPTLQLLETAGNASITATGLKGGAVVMSIAGSGAIEAGGSVEAVRVEVNGSGKAYLSQLKTNSATVHVNGSGSVTAHAGRSADVAIAGSGDVSIEGSPPHRNVAKTGSGNVRFR